MKQSEVVALAMLIKPLGLILLLAAAYPFKLLVERYMRDGKLKRLLLRRIND